MKKICRNFLRLLHFALLRCQKLFLRHSYLVIFTSLLLFFASTYYGTQLRVGIRSEDWLDQSLISTQQFLDLKKTFGTEDKLTWIVPTKWNLQNFCKFQTELFQWPQEEIKIEKIRSLFDLRRPLLNKENNVLFYYKDLPDLCQFDESHIQQIYQHPLIDTLSINAGQDLLFHFTFVELESPKKWGSADYETATRWIERLKAIEPRSYFGGSLFFQKSTIDGINWANKLNLLTAFVVALLCRVFLGTWLSGFILVFLIFFTTSLIKAGMYLSGDVADPLSSSIFVIMTIAIVEDFFFSFFYSRSQKVRLRSALRRMSLPSFFTSLTTAIGLGSLAGASNMSVQNLGFWTGVGAMIEWALVFYLLPSLCRIFPRLDFLSHQGNTYLPKWFSIIGNFTPSRRILLCLVLPLLALFYFYNKVNINYTPFDMFPASHPLVQFRDYVKTNKGYEGDVSLVFEKEALTPEDSKLIELVAHHPLVASYKEPRKMAQQLLPPNSDPALHRMIEHEIKDTSSFQEFQKNGKSRALLFIKEFDIQSLKALKDHATQICQGRCYLTGEVIAFMDYALSMLKTLYSSFIFSLATVSLLLALLSIAVSGRIFWPLILSSVWAPLALILFVSVFQIKINVVTCLALDLLIGLSGDNAVQFLLFDRKGRWKNGHTQLLPVGIMIVSSISLISLILLLSYFRTARILSGLMEFGALLMLIGDLWILNYFTQVDETHSDHSQQKTTKDIDDMMLTSEHNGGRNT